MEWRYQRESPLLEEMSLEEARAVFLADIMPGMLQMRPRPEDSSSSGTARRSNDTVQEGRGVLQASPQTAWLYASKDGRFIDDSKNVTSGKVLEVKSLSLF